MSYQNKPQFVKEGSQLCCILEDLSSGALSISEFDREIKRDYVYPAIRHGLISRKGDTLKTSQVGKKLVATAR